jgi:hypothetical protein
MKGHPMSFLRFIAFGRQGRFCASFGPFSLAYKMARDREQPIYYRRPLREHLDWFGENLPVPDRFNRRLGRASTGIGVCWFKAGAGRHISRAREMCRILDEIGYPIVCRWTAELGRPIYQDEFQIVVFDHKRPAHEVW